MDIARLREITDRLQDAKDQLAQEKSYLESEIQTELGFEEIIGQSSSLREVLKNVRVVAPTDSTVLLLGETGTGKELVARSVHSLSARRNNTFVKLNCAAVPSGLLESELFGHEKGAFTGAVSQKAGTHRTGGQRNTCFWMRLESCHSNCNQNFCGYCRTGSSRGWGGCIPCTSMCGSSRRRTAICGRTLRIEKFREDLYYRLECVSDRIAGTARAANRYSDADSSLCKETRRPKMRKQSTLFPMRR